MRIGCLQFAPQVGDVDNNLNRADSVLSKANPEDLDILVLPELAFTGYNFKSLQEISSFLEPSGSGITSLWARTVALKYDCYVAAGYPEKVDVSPKWPTSPEYYNSCIVVNGDGETIANYRKSFLYYTDETWALEGNSGFFDGWIPGLGNTSMGICMDLNPYKFEAPWHAFEFAFHVLEVKSNLVIVSMAWITREDSRRFSRKPNEPDMDSLTYWVTRLEPLIRKESNEEIIVVFCNRTGNEDEVTYCGTSAVIGIQEGEVKVYGLLGRGEKELLVVDTNKPAFAKLLYRPRVQSEDSEQASDISTHPPSRSQLLTATSKDKGERKDTPPKTEGRQNTSGRYGSGFGQATKTKLQDNTSNRRSPRPRGRSPATRQKPNISIALPPKRECREETKSPGDDDFDIPTPSAPSPTPIGLRPRIIIPESNFAKPYECFPLHADSAVSAVSAKSFNSIQTVQSNPRPPEDSTPYPHSGVPLDGDTAKVRIYDGHVAITKVDSELVPATPVDDSSPSPMTLRWFWRPSESLICSPDSGRESQLGESAEQRQGHALINPQPTSEAIEHRLTNGRPQIKPHPSQLRCKGSQTSPPKSSSNWAKRSDSLTRAAQAASEADPRLNRPSSPKSRNASRSGMDDMRNSVMGHQTCDGMSATGTPLPGRPESPKSRNCSRSRPSMWLNNNDGSSSGKPFDAGSSPPRSVSRMGRPHRSSSFTSLMMGSFTTPNNSNEKAFRTTSRGRQAGLQVSPTKSDPTSRRARSVDTVQAGAYYSQFRHHASQPQEHTMESNRPPPHTDGPLGGQQGQDPSHFERVETRVCPSCPVHGERATPAQAHAETIETDEAPLTTAAASAILRGDRTVGAPSPAPEGGQNTSSADRLRTLVDMTESSLSLSGSHPGNVNRRSAHLFEIGSLLPVTST